MNERIRELAEQAWVYQVRVYQDNGVRTYGEQEKVFDKEKFAELIVRECARVAIEKQTENDIANIVSENPAKDFAYALIEHFGVKQ